MVIIQAFQHYTPGYEHWILHADWEDFALNLTLVAFHRGIQFTLDF